VLVDGCANIVPVKTFLVCWGWIYCPLEVSSSITQGIARNWCCAACIVPIGISFNTESTSQGGKNGSFLRKRVKQSQSGNGLKIIKKIWLDSLRCAEFKNQKINVIAITQTTEKNHLRAHLFHFTIFSGQISAATIYLSGKRKTPTDSPFFHLQVSRKWSHLAH